MSQRAEVAIVGAGPVGLVLANLLGVHGVRTIVLERNTGTVDEPRAIAIDAESLRTVQALGLYEQVAAECMLGFDAEYVDASGARLFQVALRETPYGHAQQNAFDQPVLERQLLDGLARFPHVTVRFRNTLEGFTQEAYGVRLAARGVDGEPRTLRADFLVGCDGGRSTVRAVLGIAMRGTTAPQRWLVIDTLDPHLADTLPCRFFCDPARPGMTLRKLHGKRRWEWMLLPGETDAQLLDDATIRDLLARWTRPEQVRIERKCVYTFHSIVADRYRAGRALLAGDAAHMMPPFAGQGMNGGVRDAANLAWKLWAVLRGHATAELLDTYQLERREHVIAATRLANQLGAVIQPTAWWMALLRDAFFTAVNATSWGREWFESWLGASLRVPRLHAGVFVPHGGREGAPAPLAGQMLVQPRVLGGDGREVPLDELLGPGFAVLGYGDDPRALDADTRAYWTGLGARLVRVVPAGTAAALATDEAVTEAVDVTGALGTFVGDHPARLLAIRPDRFCAAQFTREDAPGALAAFRALLRPAT